jgi:hypothetical protein
MAAIREQRVESTEQRAESREQGAESRKQRVESGEQVEGAESREQRECGTTGGVANACLINVMDIIPDITLWRHMDISAAERAHM